jgi:cysteine-rich repeat protein
MARSGLGAIALVFGMFACGRTELDERFNTAVESAVGVGSTGGMASTSGIRSIGGAPATGGGQVTGGMSTSGSAVAGATQASGGRQTGGISGALSSMGGLSNATGGRTDTLASTGGTVSTVTTGGGSGSAGRTGGTTATGGATITGGVSTAGGGRTIGGGGTTRGGTVATGGMVLGGMSATGGASTGGITVAGGVNATSGVSTTGGITSMGGVGTTLGTSTNGGFAATGGLSLTGGAITTGGTAGTATAVCGNGIVEMGEACDLGNANFDRPAIQITQNALGFAAPPYARVASGADFYGYVSASGHTGLEAIGASRILLYLDKTSSLLSLVMEHGADNTTTGLDGSGRVQMRLSGLPTTTKVAVSDDANELTMTSTTTALGDWGWSNNTDGGVLTGLTFPGNWEVMLSPVFLRGITVWTWVQSNGALVSLDLLQPIIIKAYNSPTACRRDCTLPRCGDGILDGGELCDDGNTLDGDGCAGDCRSFSN